jgi:hypothetical protein
MRRQILAKHLALMAVLLAAPALPDELKWSGEVIVVRHDFSDQPVPKWENGFVLGREAAIDKEVVTFCATPSIFTVRRDQAGGPHRSIRSESNLFLR